MNPPPSEIRITVGTWNVSGLPPRKHGNLRKWLIEAPRNKLAEKGHAVTVTDVYVIGLQDVVSPDQPPSLYDKNRVQILHDKWEAALSGTLRELGVYTLFASHQMCGIHLFVFVREYLAPALINEMSKFQVARDAPSDAHGHKKGAVAIRFNALGHSVCFLCCHFEPGCGMDRCLQRNADFHHVAQNLNFSRGGSIQEHEFVFLFGDLSYRLCGEASCKELKGQLKTRGMVDLASRDELLKQQCLAEAFLGFEEMELDFEPTYKLKIGSNSYDKCEPMAWCDRITFRERQPNAKDQNSPRKLTPIVYGSAELKSSFHRPVFGVIDISTTNNNVRQVATDSSSPPSYTTEIDNSVTDLHMGMNPGDTQMQQQTRQPLYQAASRNVQYQGSLQLSRTGGFNNGQPGTVVRAGHIGIAQQQTSNIYPSLDQTGEMQYASGTGLQAGTQMRHAAPLNSGPPIPPREPNIEASMNGGMITGTSPVDGVVRAVNNMNFGVEEEFENTRQTQIPTSYAPPQVQRTLKPNRSAPGMYEEEFENTRQQQMPIYGPSPAINRSLKPGDYAASRQQRVPASHPPPTQNFGAHFYPSNTNYPDLGNGLPGGDASYQVVPYGHQVTGRQSPFSRPQGRAPHHAPGAGALPHHAPGAGALPHHAPGAGALPPEIREAALLAEAEFALHPANRFLRECEILEAMNSMEHAY